MHWKDWSWTSNTLTTWCEELTLQKNPWCWERLKAGREGQNRGWDGWMASPTWWTWVWANLGVGDGQGSLMCCSPWSHKESDMTEWLIWTETYIVTTILDAVILWWKHIHLELILQMRSKKIYVLCNID